MPRPIAPRQTGGSAILPHMLVLLLAAAIASTNNPLPDPRRLPPPVPVQSTVAWEVTLSDPPIAEPLVFASDADAPAQVVLRSEQALEARTTSDGSLSWRRDGRGGAGLCPQPLRLKSGALALAWVGRDAAQQPLFELIDSRNGESIAMAPLDGAPLGPPLLIAAAEPTRARWQVAVAGGFVQQFDGAGQAVGRLQHGASLTGRLLELGGRLTGVGLETRRLMTLGAPGRGESARELASGSLSTSGRLLVGAQYDPRSRGLGAQAPVARLLSAWDCRARGRRALACHRLWTQTLGGQITAPALIMGDVVFAAAWDTYLYAFDRRRGHLNWRVATGGRIAATPLVWGDTLVVTPLRGSTLSFFRASDGASAGALRADRDEIFLTAPARWENRLFVPLFHPDASSSNRLRGYDLKR